MKIWCISDTHNKHVSLELPDVSDIDMIIHSGDASSTQDLSNNEAEMREFMLWFSKLPYKYKIYIPGNHDTSVEANMNIFPSNIIVLKHESVTIENINIFGSPYTPSFGIGWAYNKSRNKIDEYWKQIPKDTNILITHGPPKGILDYTNDSNTSYAQCGCKSLLNHILNIKPKYHIFGHIHDEKNVLNCGIFKATNINTTFINACVMNLKYEIINNGIIINYK